jgi:hypothetical protein
MAPAHQVGFLRPTDANIGRTIELQAAAHPEVLKSLNRLEIQGEPPIGGLSSEERELIITAREIVNEC